MTTYKEPAYLSDLLLVEVKTGWTKQRVTYAAGHPIRAGLVLANVGGKFVPLDVAASDGSEKARAVAAETVDATLAEVKGVAILRGAVVDAAALLWPAAMTGPQQAAAIEQLEARGIVTTVTLAM